MSILEGKDGLRAVINDIAEVTGYLWQKGWAERNGGNITVNVTEFADASWATMPAIAPVKQIGMVLPYLKGKYFYCKGTGKRMRDLAHYPMQNGSIIRICDDCSSYEIIADEPVCPTSELPTHLALQNYLLETGSIYKATLHTHPIELVAMQRVGDHLRDGTDVLLTARLGVDALLHQHINEGNHVDIPAGQKQLVHGGENLLMLLQIKVGHGNHVGDLVEGFRINQN